MGGIRAVKAFANEGHEKKLFRAANAAYGDTKIRAYQFISLATPLNYIGLRTLQILVMLCGAQHALRGSLSVGGFIGFILLVNTLHRPLNKIGAIIETYPKGIAGLRRYVELLSIRPDILDLPTARTAPLLKGHIQFDGVTFGYQPDRPILHNINIRVQRGETVAFVGASGVGKTTLVSLIPRFYDPTSGRILIDDTDIRGFTQLSLRRQIGIVQQDVFLFGGSIRDNIAYGRVNASEREIVDAAERAHLGPLIESLPEGIHTAVGERGVKLSGGQKQRIAIARIFLKDPPIIILDEATSALDSETERQIQASLDALSRNKTTLVVAHRASTIERADRVITLMKGRILPD